MKKRVLPVLLALAMVLSLLPLSAFAAPADSIFDQPNAVITGLFNNRVVIKTASATVRDATLNAGLHVDASTEGVTITITGKTTVTTVSLPGLKSKVVIDKDVKAESVSIEGEGAEVEVHGEVETVTVAESAAGSSVTVSETATVSTVEAAAPNTAVDVSGKVENVTVTEAAEGASVKVAETATVSKVEAAAPNTAVDVSGKVEEVAVAETAAGASVNVNETAAVSKVETAAPNTSLDIKSDVQTVAATEKAEGTTIKTGEGTKVDNISVESKNSSVEANGTVGTISGGDNAENLTVKASETAKVDKVDVKTDATVDVAAGATVGTVTAPEDVKVDVSGEGAGNVTVETTPPSEEDPDPEESSETTVPVDPGNPGLTVSTDEKRYPIVVKVAAKDESGTEVKDKDGNVVYEEKVVGERKVSGGYVTDTLYDGEGVWPEGTDLPQKSSEVAALVQIGSTGSVYAYNTLKAAITSAPKNTKNDDGTSVKPDTAFIKVWDAAAVPAATEDGKTATVTDAQKAVLTIQNGQQVVLDLNGKTINNTFQVLGNGADYTTTKREGDDGACLTLDDTAGKGTIEMIKTGTAIRAWKGGKIVMNGGTINGGDAELKKTTAEYKNTDGNWYYGVAVFNGSEFVMNDGTIDTNAYPVNTNGSASGASCGKGCQITINGGTIIGAQVGIYNPADSTVTVYGGTIKGDWAALLARDGTIDLIGGTFVNLDYTSYTDDSTWKAGDGAEQLPGNPAIAIIPSYVKDHGNTAMVLKYNNGGVILTGGGIAFATTQKTNYTSGNPQTQEELLAMIKGSDGVDYEIFNIKETRFLTLIDSMEQAAALAADMDAEELARCELSKGEYLEVNSSLVPHILEQIQLMMLADLQADLKAGTLVPGAAIFEPDEVRLYWTKDGDGKDFIVLVGTKVDSTGEWSLPGQTVLVTVNVPDNYTGAEKLDATITATAMAPVKDAQKYLESLDQETLEKGFEETKQLSDESKKETETPAEGDKIPAEDKGEDAKTPGSGETKTPAEGAKTPANDNPGSGETKPPANDNPGSGETKPEPEPETPATAETFDGVELPGLSETIHIVVNTGTGTAEAAD